MNRDTLRITQSVKVLAENNIVTFEQLRKQDPLRLELVGFYSFTQTTSKCRDSS